MRSARKRFQDGDADMDISGLSMVASLNPGPQPDSMDVSSEYSGPTDNTHITHSNKRPRISNADSEEHAHPPTVTIINLPLEVLTEIFKYLRPEELLSLARCKAFRGYLMHVSSQSIWWDVMKNVRELPPCPRGFSEPQYLTVLFSNFCTVCGNTKKPQLDAILLVRLCKNCQKDCLARLFSFHEVPVEVREFIHKSNVFGKGRSEQLPEARVLKSDVHNIIKALEEAGGSGSDCTLTELKEQMREAVLERRVQSEKITRALELSEYDQEWEKKEIRKKRRLEIQRRCIDDLGVRREDLQFAWDSPKRGRYYKLLNKPCLLNDCEWGEIRPELKRLIDTNRKTQLDKGQDDRHRNQSSYQAGTGRLRQPLILEIDPVMDGLYHTEEIELLV